KQQAANCSYPHISVPEIPACYFEVKETGNYSEVSNRCQEHGMHVASVLSKKENDFLLTFLMGKYGNSFEHFLGLTEQGTWEDGSPVSFINGSSRCNVALTRFGWKCRMYTEHSAICKRIKVD
ncbi:unnamed protein product, partial [Enterobius vermicularis]|uniref:C-type lectin domain-containing protein n=1 Tax=Enterobius vermicularis TaxID=51028 RepID=A0A0N4UUB5_ENTVE